MRAGIGHLSVCMGVIVVSAASAPAVKRQWEIKPTTLSVTLEQRFPDDSRVQAGFLPVTLYGADPSGARDSTAAIRNAIRAAYENGMACFFPAGTYLVSEQLECKQPRDQMTQAHVLVGSGVGPRPVLRLADKADGFGDPAKPRAVVRLWAHDPQGKEDVPSAYNMQFRGIDVRIGAGNPGAVGVYLHGAQGCTVQDVKVSGAGPFHAGFQHLIGSGGGVQNLEVIGGKHAIDAADDSAKHPVVAGLRAIDQTEEIVRIGTATVITLVGLQVERDRGPCLVAKRKWWECSSHLSIVDAVVRFREPGQTLIRNVDRSVYLNNVYVQGAATLVDNLQERKASATGRADGWSRIEEYSFYHKPHSRLIGGQGPEPNNPPVARIETDGIEDAQIPDDMISRHVWGPAAFPHFESTGAINVRDPAFGAMPNDGKDDSDALQRAIDAGARANRPVFLPKGEYHIGRTLSLHANTVLFGVSRNLTILNCLPDWTAEENTPMLDTVDDADARTTLAFMRIEVPAELSRRIFHVRWRAGRHSMVRDVWFEKPAVWAPRPPVEMVRALVTGNGGGRWYNLFHRAGRDATHPKYRYLLLDGTTEPFNLYTYCPEYAEEDCEYQFEFRNSRNICVFGLKAETSLKNAPIPTLGIIGCDNVLVTGNTGIGTAPDDRGIIEVGASTNVTLANSARFGKHHSNQYYYVLDLDNGKGLLESLQSDPDDQTNNTASLFKLGHCRPVFVRP